MTHGMAVVVVFSAVIAAALGFGTYFVARLVMLRVPTPVAQPKDGDRAAVTGKIVACQQPLRSLVRGVPCVSYYFRTVPSGDSSLVLSGGRSASFVLSQSDGEDLFLSFPADTFGDARQPVDSGPVREDVTEREFELHRLSPGTDIRETTVAVGDDVVVFGWFESAADHDPFRGSSSAVGQRYAVCDRPRDETLDGPYGAYILRGTHEELCGFGGRQWRIAVVVSFVVFVISGGLSAWALAMVAT